MIAAQDFAMHEEVAMHEDTDGRAADPSAFERAALELPIGGPGSGRDRYAAAMYLYHRGEIGARTLEIYRICARLDTTDPRQVMAAEGVTPAD